MKMSEISLLDWQKNLAQRKRAPLLLSSTVGRKVLCVHTADIKRPIT